MWKNGYLAKSKFALGYSICFLMEPTALNRSLKKPMHLTLVFLIIASTSATLLDAQELFREPTVPAHVAGQENAKLPVEIQKTSIAKPDNHGLKAPTQDSPGFVPDAKPQTRLRPIVPRGGVPANNVPTEGVLSPASRGMDQQSVIESAESRSSYDEFQPIIPGRTDLRSIVEGTFEENELPPEENSGPEVVTQRYPDGKPQLIKQVAQDAEGNYYNHGDWTLLNRRGQTLAEGQFKEGVMDGLWRRWHPQDGGGIFATRPFDLFKGPFLSTATFSNGELEGMWTLYDNYERKIFEIPYREGIRDGTASWWFPNAVKMREVIFKKGLIDGPLREWNDQNEPVRYEEFIDGKKIIRQTTFYRPKIKQDENYFLDGKLELSGGDDWWQARPAGFQVTGARIQHGPALAWYDNNQPKMKGQYRDDVRVGRFTWWHQNGQKALEGDYDDKGNKIGSWTWWHPNGIKSIQGQYKDDVPTLEWTWWDSNGQVQSKEIMDEQESEIQITEDSPEKSTDDVTNKDDAILTTPDEFEGLEEVEPFGEGSYDILPGKKPDDEDITADENNSDAGAKSGDG